MRGVRQKAINASAPEWCRVCVILCRPAIVVASRAVGAIVRLFRRDAIAIVRDGTDEGQGCEVPLQLEGGV